MPTSPKETTPPPETVDSLPAADSEPEDKVQQLREAIRERDELVDLFRSSEQRLRSLMEWTTEAVFCIEFHPPVPLDLPLREQVEQILEGILVECNEACARSQGKDSPDELLGRNVLDAFAIRPEQAARLFGLMGNKGYQQTETQMTDRGEDGIDRYYSITLNGIVEEGRLVRIWGTYTDITERIRAERLLRIQRNLSVDLGECADPKQMAELVLEAALQIDTVDCGGVYLFDTETKGLDLACYQGLSEEFAHAVRHYNDQTPQWAMISPGKPVYKHSSELEEDLLPKAHTEELRAFCVMPITWENETIGAINVASRSHDSFPQAIKDAMEALTGMVGGALIRARSEKKTQEALAKLRAVMESPSDIIIFSLDRSLSYTAFNEAHRREMRSLFGSEIRVGMNMIEAVQSEPGRGILRSAFQRVLNGETFTNLFQEEDLDVFYQMTLSPILDERGEVDGISAFVQNVTRRMKERKERVELQDRLRQSEKLEAVGQLAGGIAHDFNNQLATIMTHAEVMKQWVSSQPELTPYVEDILAAAGRAKDLTSQLLAFARKGQFVSVPVDVHQCLREVVALLQRSLDKRILIWEDRRAERPLLQGDPSQLQNAFLNLALNARDAMPEGGDLRFTTRNLAFDEASSAGGPDRVEPGDYVVVSVSDTGTGIPPELQKRVFEPFFTTKGDGQGTGMGLAAVYGTVRSHKGFLSLESAVGKGTTVHLYLPAIDGAPEQRGPRDSLPAPLRGSGRILLVDDEALLLRAASNALRKLGYDVVARQSGAEATAFYRDHWQEVDLVILDLIMPEMGGKEVFLALREINPNVRVLISSGYSMDSAPQDLISEGVNGLLHKPFSLAELSQKIASAMEPR